MYEYHSRFNGKKDGLWKSESFRLQKTPTVMKTKVDSLHFATEMSTSSSETPSNNMAKDKSKKSIKCDSAIFVGNFGRHLRIHSGEKSHKCEQCDFASAHAGNLKRHIKIHD